MEPQASRRRHCLDLLGELSDYLDGDLSPARCRAIERHLEACPCCDQFADGLRRAIAVCREAGAKRLPREVRSRAQARIDALLGKSAPARTRLAQATPTPNRRAAPGAGKVRST
jgi:anti-sigma factor RsiW